MESFIRKWYLNWALRINWSLPGKESKLEGGGGGGWTFQAEPEQHVQKTESKKAMKYLWKGDMFHVTEVPLIKVSG